MYKETPTAIAKDGDGVIRHGVIGDYGKGVGAVLFGISAKSFAFYNKSQLAHREISYALLFFSFLLYWPYGH